MACRIIASSVGGGAELGGKGVGGTPGSRRGASSLLPRSATVDTLPLQTGDSAMRRESWFVEPPSGPGSWRILAAGNWAFWASGRRRAVWHFGAGPARQSSNPSNGWRFRAFPSPSEDEFSLPRLCGPPPGTWTIPPWLRPLQSRRRRLMPYGRWKCQARPAGSRWADQIVESLVGWGEVDGRRQFLRPLPAAWDGSWAEPRSRRR